ncbi:NUDIX domain-containing protein [Candidatus Nomurabacteria bacterium]|uniref:NUDIX domain-containing protein n=1 Tax=Candidatus Dojkabacteria bacterium TaxID=2099670 RepID=A0A955KXZ1_9BACT|nr:NUDIX domain-containing protein [Candidatus Dojkabacteria bacterium]MCB9790120.1 NUDIX domain-containing protein [Candidatus Nomurabacteria bacterium]MCB9803360.1 NUDIX domain-containing protein [Candidatus Nomurabacteria bacterium]
MNNMKEIYKVNVEGTNITVCVETYDRSYPVILFIAGTSGNSLSDRFDGLSEMLINERFTFVRFNFRGHEEGRTIDEYSLNDELKDMKEVIELLEHEGYNTQNLSILAKSFGAVKAFCLNREYGLIGLLSPAVFFSERGNLGPISSKEYKNIASIEDINIPLDVLRNITAPVCIVHGENDSTIPISNSSEIFSNLATVHEKKELHKIPGANHSMLDKAQYSEAYKLITSFFRKYRDSIWSYHSIVWKFKDKEYLFDVITSSNFKKIKNIRQVYTLMLSKDKDKIMLVHNTQGIWILPGGGVERGESHIDTIVREVREETNCDIDLSTVEPLYYQLTYVKKPSGRWEYHSAQLRYKAVVKKERKFVEDPDNGDIDEVRWVSIDEIHRYLDWGKTVDIIKELLLEK